MKLSDKLIELRKEKGWSQEEFAEKLDVSRQAVSRWENETAQPDAQNILRISKLFNVTSDYLLNDDYEKETLIPTINASSEKTEATVQKKKYPYLIAAICFITLVVCIITGLMVCQNISRNKEQHTHDILISLKENEISPTCTAKGSYDEVVYCTECDKELLRTARSIAKLSHTPSTGVKEKEMAPTCTANGSYDEVIYCGVCNSELSRTHITLEMLAHRFENKKCTACGEDQPSEGLFFMSAGDGTCSVSLGDCTDENVVIPSYSPSGEKVVQIKAYAFWGCSGLKSVKIPETVTVIGEGAFKDCSNLESVNLPSKITIISSYTFDGCTKLKGVNIPSGVQYIGEEAFADCIAFEGIVIPASVTKIGKFAFRNFSGCDGNVRFEIYKGWGIYDSDELIKIVDFNDTVLDPVIYLTYRFSEYVWKRS